MNTATRHGKSAVEIERELTQATDDYLRGKIKLDELDRLEEKYRQRREPVPAPSREPAKDYLSVPARGGTLSGQHFV